MPSPSASPTATMRAHGRAPQGHGAGRRRRADDRRDRRPLHGARRVRTHGAGDGPEALRLADLRRPDLVVLDLMLPGIDGIEVMRRLHERPGRPRSR